MNTEYLPLINRGFKSHGLMLRADAAKSVCKFVAEEVDRGFEYCPDASKSALVKSAVDTLVRALKADAAGASSSFVEAAAISAALATIRATAAASASRSSSASASSSTFASGVSSQQLVMTDDGTTRPATAEEAVLLERAAAGVFDPRFSQVVDAYAMPVMDYAASRRTYVPSTREHRLHGSAVDKSKMFVERRALVEQRLRRDPRFATSAAAAAAAAATSASREGPLFEITRIEALLGQSGERCVFGMLTEVADGVWHIEDENASIRVDLSRFATQEGAADLEGLYMDHCFVIAEGVVSNSVFVVSMLAAPPAEDRATTLRSFPALDMCGTQQNLVALQRTKDVLAQALTQHRAEDRVVFLSEVHLDDPAVLRRLRKLFQGLESMNAAVIVLIGNFASPAMLSRARDLAAYTKLFDTLADIIAQHPYIAQNTQVVLIPGPRDPNIGNILPAPALAPGFTARLRAKVRHFVSASNPARLLFFGQEICIFRGDLHQRFRRAAVLCEPAGDAVKLCGTVAKTVCDQAHLSPMALTKQPVAWNFDHALRLYPLPDVLLLADVVDNVEDDYQGCKFVTPGAFANNGTFLVYLPASKTTEFSSVD